MQYKQILLLALTGLGFITNAFSQFSIDGEFRSRGIVENGFKIPARENDQARLSFDQRSRLIFNYSNEKYETRFSLQDARIWGSEDIMSKTGPEGSTFSTAVYEAWVKLKLSNISSLKIGRQEWNYDDMRILSWRNIWTAGMSYDGVLYQMYNKDNGLNIDLGVSYNNNGSPMGISVNNSEWPVEKLKTMNFINIKKKIGSKLTTSLMLTLSGKTDITNNAVLGTGTHGLNINYNTGKKGSNGFFAAASGYYQHGTDMKRGSDGEYKNISAYLIAAHTGIRTLEKSLELSVGMELISGHDYTNTDEDYNNTRHTFDLQYSGRYPYYGGYMNHFIIQDSYVTGTKGGGYFDPYFKAKYKLNKKNIIEAAYFIPMLTTKVKAHTGIDPQTKKPIGAEVDENGNPVYWKGNLGNYIDLSYTYKMSKEIILKAGMSYAMISDLKNQMTFGYKNPAIKELHSPGTNYFGWAMIIVKPAFFKQ